MGFQLLGTLKAFSCFNKQCPCAQRVRPAIHKKIYIFFPGWVQIYFTGLHRAPNLTPANTAEQMLLRLNVSKWLTTGADIWRDFIILYNYSEKGFFLWFGWIFKLTILCNLQTEQSLWHQTAANRKTQNSMLPAKCLHSNVKPDTWWPW